MKNKLVQSVLIIVLSAFILGSCIESEYHWDNLNKEGVINLPPVPLGSFAPIVLKDLGVPEIILPEIVLQERVFEYKDTFENLFSNSSVKHFFHDYMETDVKIIGDLDMAILGDESGFSVDINFDVLDADHKVIKEVKIEGLKNLDYGHHKLEIVIPHKTGGEMKRAEHLQVRIAITTPHEIVMTKDDYIKLSSLVIQTAGYFIDL